MQPVVLGITYYTIGLWGIGFLVNIFKTALSIYTTNQKAFYVGRTVFCFALVLSHNRI